MLFPNSANQFDHSSWIIIIILLTNWFCNFEKCLNLFQLRKEQSVTQSENPEFLFILHNSVIFWFVTLAIAPSPASAQFKPWSAVLLVLSTSNFFLFFFLFLFLLFSFLLFLFFFLFLFILISILVLKWRPQWFRSWCQGGFFFFFTWWPENEIKIYRLTTAATTFCSYFQWI